MKNQLKMLQDTALLLDSFDEPAMFIAASIIRGFLTLSLAEQVRITMIGNGVPILMATTISQDIGQVETMQELANKPVSTN